MRLGLLAMAAALMLAAPVMAQDLKPATPLPGPPAAKDNPPSIGGAALTETDVAALSDGLIPAAIAVGNVAGVVVVVVKDGHVLFQKGYGVADVDKRTPVDPAKTLFRPGSVSKLFTWTAVMQLADAGKIDLDTDINRYLDFKIPPAFGKPITMRNLMTHTPGFDETYRSLMIGDPRALEPLRQVVSEDIPARSYPPGAVPAYSNYGATLAGYIVQRVSGEKFEDYIQHHIFAPLGMTHATFVQPLPKELAGDMSKGYQVASGPATPFEMINMGPAGGLSASGSDIAKFMIAHLEGGGPILSPRAAERMHSVASNLFPDLSPMAHGFYRDDKNGHVVIEHGGDTGVFHSQLSLLLNDHVGLFYSTNTLGANGAGARLRRAWFNAFMNRYFPAPPAKPMRTLASAHDHAMLLAGSYAMSRRAGQSFASYLSIFQPVWVTRNADDTIGISALVTPAGITKKWREVKPFVWEEVNGDSRVQALVRDGKVTEIATDDIGPIIVLQPAEFRLAAWNLYLLIATAAMFALTLIFWPVKAVLRWRYDRPFALSGRARQLYRLTRLTALADLIFLAGFPLGFLSLTTSLASHSASIDWLWRALQLIGVIGIIGTIAVALNFFAALGDRGRPWWTKVTDALLLVAALATVWFAFSQNLLSVGLNY
jgi:CubicO group peptidase (beta-lactamase class C family)